MVNHNPPVVMVRRNQDADEVVREVQNNNLLGQNNLTNLVETILAQNGLNIGCRMPNFVSALTEYVLQTELLRGWKVPKYTKFAGILVSQLLSTLLVPEHELVEMAGGGLDYSIRKKLDTQYLRDMSQLADRVRQIERLKAEKFRNSKFQKKKEITFIDSYGNEIDYEVDDEYSEFEDSDVNVAELKSGPPYT
ncbi:hypothetical protein L195_g051499, partial [Trifolium pratense]